MGDDTLEGNSGADRFVFDDGLDEGNDVILDFRPGEDLLVVAGGSWTGVTITPVNAGADAQVELSGGTVILLAGVAAASLTEEHFLFV